MKQVSLTFTIVFVASLLSSIAAITLYNLVFTPELILSCDQTERPKIHW